MSIHRKIYWNDNESRFQHIGKHLLGIRSDGYNLGEPLKWENLLGEKEYLDGISELKSRYSGELEELRKLGKDEHFKDPKIAKSFYSTLNELYFNVAKELVNKGLESSGDVIFYIFRDYKNDKFNIYNFTKRENNLTVGGKILNHYDFRISTCFFKDNFDLKTETILEIASVFNKFRDEIRNHQNVMKLVATDFDTNDEFMLKVISESFDYNDTNFINDIDLISNFLWIYFKSRFEQMEENDNFREIYITLINLFGPNHIKPIEQGIVEWAEEININYLKFNSNKTIVNIDYEHPLFNNELALAMIISEASSNENSVYSEYLRARSENPNNQFLEMVVDLVGKLKK